MSFKQLVISQCYESGTNDIVQEFYAPVLSESIRYDRIAGFFSSSSLAVAARGMADFIVNGGQMRLICSPILHPDDYEIIKAITTNGELSLEDIGLNLEDLESEFAANHVKALGWLLAHGQLQMKLALVCGDDGSMLSKDTLFSMGLFHQKVGIFTDKEGNRLSFSGSINETAAAWINNEEEFKVFKEWDDNSDYFVKDVERFEKLWNGAKKNVQVYDLPNAIVSDLIRYGRDFDAENISAKHYLACRASRSEFERDGITLFYYQRNAVKKWKDSNYRMLFEMATGTGKTRTAVSAINYLMAHNSQLIVIISCPQNTLARQWKENEVEKLGVKADMASIIDGTNRNWKNDLQSMLLQNSIGFADHCIIYTSHDTASSEQFISIMKSNLGKNAKVLFIGDEVHWLGAKKLRKALLERYNYRIGLSATPSRWFDDQGTAYLVNYFGNNHFEFTIKDALNEINPITGKHFLVNYYYHISQVSLTDTEGEEYSRLTERISRLYRMKDDDPDTEESYTRLLEKRADIIKNASNKYDELENILDRLIAANELENMIIFVSPQQIDYVKEILFDKNVAFHQLTQNEGTKPESRFDGMSERQHIINCFKKGIYKVLLAIKCLDEGIDIPTASRGILMASSTNPREYIQRIGRIIRQSPKKKFAYLYDICVDSIACLSGEDIEIERKIRRNEQRRLQEIAENALNAADAMSHIFELNL